MWKKSNLPFLKNDRPLVMAHRGDSANIPENTIQSFEDAYALGVDCIETDVRLTKDNHFVFFHDGKTSRTTNGTKRVLEYTLKELKQLDAGYKFESPDSPNSYPFRGKGLQIMTIEEILPKYPNIRFNMDIKNTGKEKPEAPQLLAELLQSLDAEKRVMVGSFHQDQIINFRKFSEVPTSAGPKETYQFWRKSKKIIQEHSEMFSNNNLNSLEHKLEQNLIFGEKLPYYAFQIPEKLLPIIRIVTPDFVKLAHLLDVAVQIWTINEAEDMKRLLEWNVDGIFTDNPKVLLDVVKKIHK